MKEKQVSCKVCGIKLWVSEEDAPETHICVCGVCVCKIGKLLVDSKKNAEPEPKKDNQ